MTGASTVLFLRHGRTAYNLEGRFQGQLDIPLDEVGRGQAREAALGLSTVGAHAVVSSDLSRALETARIVGDRLGIDVTPDPRLRERSFGTWQGMHRNEIAERWPAQYAAWTSGSNVEGIGAESRGAAGARVAEAVREHAAAMPDGSTLLVVAHGACIAAGATALLGLDAETWFGLRGVANCRVTELSASPHDPPWRLTGHNLPPGGVPDAGGVFAVASITQGRAPSQGPGVW